MCAPDGRRERPTCARRPRRQRRLEVVEPRQRRRRVALGVRVAGAAAAEIAVSAVQLVVVGAVQRPRHSVRVRHLEIGHALFVVVTVLRRRHAAKQKNKPNKNKTRSTSSIIERRRPSEITLMVPERR